MNRLVTQARSLAALSILALLVAPAFLMAQALSPVFTYQGELRLSSGPASASFDMQFRLYSAQAGGSQIGSTLSANAVAVAGGLFSVPLDFGPAQFAGDRQWLEIAIRPAGSGSFETLSPRTELTAAPYAWSAAVALTDSVTTSSVVDGTIGTADVNATQVQRRVTGTCSAGQYVRVISQTGTVTCGTDADAGGSVTSIATGAGLTGGPITSTGSIAVAAGGIGTIQINSSQVQRRVSGSCPAGQYVRVVNEAGTVTCGTDTTGAAGWGLGGNAGTNPATNFIGTTDAQPFVVRTQNVQSLRIEPSTILFGGAPITTNTIAGSSANLATAGVRGATIAGGGSLTGETDPDFGGSNPNVVTDHYGTVNGGYANRAGDTAGTPLDRFGATVGGGIGNNASGRSSTVSGGISNTASGFNSTVGGGSSNLSIGSSNTVGGGSDNTASDTDSTVGGGGSNTASESSSTVGGGFGNTASGFGSTVGGGDSNTASGSESAITGGSDNCAGGSFSWAGGIHAKVRPGSDPGGEGACSGLSYPGGGGDSGSFVWADNQSSDFVSTGVNQFLVRAQGGAAINSIDPAGNALRVAGTLRVDTLGAAGATALCRNALNQMSSCSSSARYKQDISTLELSLDSALRLRAVGYRWKDTGVADIGFVAEEIAAIDERLVTRDDMGQIEGVKYDRLTAVLASAVQDLAAHDSLALEAIERAEAENAALRAELDRRDRGYQTRLQRLEALLHSPAERAP